MTEEAQAVLNKIDGQLFQRHQAVLAELASLRYVYDSEDRKTFLSGKLEAFEELKALVLLLRV